MGGRAGGTAGMVTAGGLTSFDLEYKSGVLDGLQKAGVDIGNREALAAALAHSNNRRLGIIFKAKQSFGHPDFIIEVALGLNRF